jgi:hypothetical protein
VLPGSGERLQCGGIIEPDGGEELGLGATAAGGANAMGGCEATGVGERLLDGLGWSVVP